MQADMARIWKEIQKELALENSPQVYYFSSYFCYCLRDDSAEYANLSMLLGKNIESGMDDYAVQAVDRIGEICTSDARRAGCRRDLDSLQRIFPDNMYLEASVAECYGKIGLRAEAVEVAKRVAGVPGLSEQVRERMGKIVLGN